MKKPTRTAPGKAGPKQPPATRAGKTAKRVTKHAPAKQAKVKRPARPRENEAARRARAAEILRRLHAEYPDAKCSLDYHNAYELLTATILSAQCTDERVNMVTPALFRRYPTPEDMAGARPEEMEELIRPTGFFRNKTKSLLGMSTALAELHGGRVPEEMEQLVDLPGVGRKTANVVLGNAFGKNEGVVVDTHVRRVSGRLGLTKHNEPEKIEVDLMRLIERHEWTILAHLFIYHGRAVCRAPTPRCEVCILSDICPSSRV